MQTVMENLLSNSAAKYFALCESCFWSATVLRIKERVDCPACAGGRVSLILLAMDEQYRIKLGVGTGLELSFSKRAI